MSDAVSSSREGLGDEVAEELVLLRPEEEAPSSLSATEEPLEEEEDAAASIEQTWPV